MFNLANLFTAGNLLSGLLAILLAFMGRIDIAPFAIFAGALFDFFDGLIARQLKVSGELGKQLDSLADLVTFGVAPGVIMMVVIAMDVPDFLANGHTEVIRYEFFTYLEQLMLGKETFALPFVAFLIPVLSMFRLAKFNTDKRQSESFIGLPTPANTLFFMTFPLVLCYGNVSYDEVIAFLFDAKFLSIIVICVSLLMVTEVPLFSLKFKTFDWKSNKMRYSFLLISAVFIFIFRTWSIALIVLLYVLLSLIENSRKK